MARDVSQTTAALALAFACLYAAALPILADDAQKVGDVDIRPGHSPHGEVFDAGPRQRAHLMGGTGNVSMTISTQSQEAQQFFNQGLGQLHGFWYFEAERSFRQAAALDPDCAMAYWGMAMANRENPRRGRAFILEAVKRKGRTSPSEVAWINAIDHYFSPEGNKNPQDRPRRRLHLVRALEEMVHDHPDEIEARAFLALVIWENKSQIEMGSHEAVAALLREVHAANRMHPAHHYAIHLWDGEAPRRALLSAALCGQSAPGIAHMWHMPGHTYSKLQRYIDAAWQQEAAARVDHARMIADRVMPYQIHNYVHNNQWLIENLTYVGRVREAVRLAANLAELPRHPRHNGQSSTPGRRLITILTDYELWEDLLRLAQTQFLQPAGPEEERIYHRALGAALIAKGEFAQAKTHIEALQSLRNSRKASQAKAATEAETKAKANNSAEDQIAKLRGHALGPFKTRLEAVENALDELHGRWALAGNDVSAALAHFEKCKDLSLEFRSRIELHAGNSRKAEKLARQAVTDGDNRVLPLANCIEILVGCGKQDEAAEMFRKLQRISAFIDRDVPIFQRLDELAPKLGLAHEWRLPYQPPDDIGERPDLESLGPFCWRPSPAPGWTLPDPQGNVVSMNEYRGRPFLLIFYLGVGCLHCVEQLNAFDSVQRAFAQLGIGLVAISSDAVDTLRGSVEAYASSGKPSLPIRLLSDSKLEVFKSYRAYDDFENIPLHGTFLLDAEGLVRWQDIGPEPFTNTKFLLDETRRLLNLEPQTSADP